MRQFVNECLHDVAERVAARCAQVSRRHAERHGRDADGKVRNAGRRKFRAIKAGTCHEVRAFVGKTDEVILPRREFAAGVNGTLQLVESGGTIEVVPDIVLAGPQHLDRCAGQLRDHRRFDHIVVVEPTTEAATATHHVNRDVFFCDAKRLRDEHAPRLRILRRRPDLNRVVPEAGGAVLGLECGMREERILVGRFNGVRRSGECGGNVAIGAQRALRCLCKELHCLRPDRCAALLGGAAFFPRNFQFRARRFRGPPRVGDDRNAAQQPVQYRAAFDDERVLHAGQRLDLFDIGAGCLATEDRALFECRVKHARHRDIDAEQWLAGDNLVIVDARYGLADDTEVFRILECHRRHIRRGKRCRRRCERAIRRGSVRCGVMHDA